MAISLGTQFQVDTDGDIVRSAGLTSTTGIALYSSAASGIEARHLTNTGGILAGGTVLAIDANAADTLAICRLTDTTALIGYAYGATHRVRVVTVTGTTLSLGAIRNMTDTGIDFADCDALTSTSVIYCYMSATGTGDGVARVLTISGTTVSGEGAAFTYENGFAAAHTAVAAFPDAISAIVFFDSNAEILDISGTTVTGNASHFESGMSTGTTGDNHSDIGIDPDDATLIYVVSASGANTGRIQTFIRSGGSLTAPGSPTVVNSTGGSASSISLAVMSGQAAVTILDPSNTSIWISEFDTATFLNVDTDTSITIGAGSSSIRTELLPGTTTALAVWEGTTEAITITLPGATLSLAAMTKPASLSADGSHVYVALLANGTPVITKISTALNADGSTVFNPGAGDNIGVECGRFDADVIWVAGNFDGTNVIEKSEDGGSTFVVKDDATIGDIRSFVMGPDTDDRLLVFDETNGDILETINSGDIWTNINASVTPEVNAIARLGQNVEESVFGNDGAVNDNVNYSINSGDDLEDFNLPVNQDVTRVIVN